MSWQISSTSVSQFADQLAEASGVDINVCYQCKKCASGCPIAYAVDYTPVQLLHAARLGLKDLVLSSKAIWLCLACETCVARCPQEVDIVKVMDALRAMALQAGVKPQVPEVASFYRASLRNIRVFGRMYELGLIGQLKLATRELDKDVRLGLEMFKKRKLKMLPDFASLGKASGIFSRARKLERR
ncbi:MAG: 4Fe-4S dicluster domain-containing protein [Chloroflexi bacterium]|nr:4Fe-4S dicluster domain-containing protein [Chloroflexota bacterium]MCL5027069.1 4Fe-4S dicluster domain-containing protein [Chloroflexota bacterium]